MLVLPLLSCLVAPFEEDDANAAATSSSGKKKRPIAALAIDLRSPLNAPPPVGRGASGGASRLDLGGKRRSLRGPWGKRRSLRGVVHHIRSMGGSTRYVMTSFLLIPRRYSCRDLRRLAQINAKLRTRRAPLLRGRVLAPHDNSILIQIAASPFAATRGCRNIFTPTCLQRRDRFSMR